MDADEREILRKIQMKLGQRMAEARTPNPEPISSLDNIPILSSTDTRISVPDQENPQEIIIMKPHSGFRFPDPPLDSHFEERIDPCSPSSSTLGVSSSVSSSERTDDFCPHAPPEVGQVSIPSFSIQALALDQFLEILSQTEQSRDQSQIKVQDLKDRLRGKEKYCSVLEQRVSLLSERVKELERILEASSERAIQAQETFATKIEQLTLEHEQELDISQTSSFVKGFKAGQDQGLSMGIRDCRSNFLMTPYGQAFLDSLVKQLPEAFINSPYFWARMIEPLTNWAADIVFECCDQLGVPEQAAFINLVPITHLFETKPEALKRNCFIPTGEPWFMPVLRKASEVLCQPFEPSEDLPAWDAPLFPLFSVDTTVMRLMKKAFDEVPPLFFAIALFAPQGFIIIIYLSILFPRQELTREKIVCPSFSQEAIPTVHTSSSEEGGSGTNDAFNVPLGHPKDNWILPSTETSPVSKGETSSSHLSSSKDLAFTPDPTF